MGNGKWTMEPRRNPQLLFFLLAGAAIVVLSAVAAGRFGMRWVYAYLAAVNLCTFLAYGYDKASAMGGRLRIPEVVLHVLALVGGSAGAWVGQKAFHHKTVKSSFQRAFWLILALQALGVGLWFHYT
jgi:uncharacterized membrane protein YsdA (DUF1294 family)